MQTDKSNTLSLFMNKMNSMGRRFNSLIFCVFFVTILIERKAQCIKISLVFDGEINVWISTLHNLEFRRSSRIIYIEFRRKIKFIYDILFTGFMS
jgi:hypothetical protein